MDELLSKAFNDYVKLVEIVKEFQGTLEQLCEHLSGFNFMDCDKLFDCDCGVITATVYEVDGDFFVHEYIDVYDDKKGECVKQAVSYVDCKPKKEG